MCDMKKVRKKGFIVVCKRLGPADEFWYFNIKHYSRGILRQIKCQLNQTCSPSLNNFPHLILPQLFRGFNRRRCWF